MAITMFYRAKNMKVEVYQFFETKKALIYDPQQASMSKGNGWQIVAMKQLVPLEYVTDDMFVSKSEKNKIKERLILTHATWTCTDGVDFNDCDEAISHERELMKEEKENKNAE